MWSSQDSITVRYSKIYKTSLGAVKKMPRIAPNADKLHRKWAEFCYLLKEFHYFETILTWKTCDSHTNWYSMSTICTMQKKKVAPLYSDRKSSKCPTSLKPMTRNKRWQKLNTKCISMHWNVYLVNAQNNYLA